MCQRKSKISQQFWLLNQSTLTFRYFSLLIILFCSRFAYDRKAEQLLQSEWWQLAWLPCFDFQYCLIWKQKGLIKSKFICVEIIAGHFERIKVGYVAAKVAEDIALIL